MDTGRQDKTWSNIVVIDREAREIMYLVASVHLSDLSRLNGLTYDLDFFVWGSTLTLARLELLVKVVGQRSRSNTTNRVLISVTLL